MGIRESLLNTITSVGNSDFVRIVTSAGASSKATVANLFKSFESGLSAKSSLGTSDYIRVVGSDNNAYKESVSSVKTAMGIDRLNNITKWHVYNSQTTREALLNAIDADISEVGQTSFNGYIVGTQAVLLGLVSASYYMTMFANSVNYRAIRFTQVNGLREYVLAKQDGVWASSPILLPTRAEVDSLYSQIQGKRISGSGSSTDLNDYNTVGAYYSDSQATTATLTNLPQGLTTAFSMLVLNKGGNNIQVIFDYGGHIYSRGKITAGWQGWCVFAGVPA